MMEIHGASDTTVSYFGGKGEGGQLPAIPFWVDWWGERNKCVNRTETWLFNNTVDHTTFTCNGQNGLVQSYVVVDLGKWLLLLSSRIFASSSAHERDRTLLGQYRTQLLAVDCTSRTYGDRGKSAIYGLLRLGASKLKAGKKKETK